MQPSSKSSSQPVGPHPRALSGEGKGTAYSLQELGSSTVIQYTQWCQSQLIKLCRIKISIPIVMIWLSNSVATRAGLPCCWLHVYSETMTFHIHSVCSPFFFPSKGLGMRPLRIGLQKCILFKCTFDHIKFLHY